ncbi:type II CAAX endopeptidase family protein [Hymenobacter koreensis]
MKGFTREDTLHPALSLVLLFVLVLTGAVVAFFLTLGIGAVSYGVTNQDELSNIVASPAKYVYGWEVLMWMQGLTLLLGFGASAYILPIIRGQQPFDYFMPRRPVPLWWLLAAMVLVVVSVPAMSGFIAWNAEMHLPTWLYGFERWARLKEDQAQELTTFLTRFTSSNRFLVAVLVVAVIPAIAEELTFRGVMLRQFTRWTGSVHWGVWLSAVVFSAIHAQFFGFIPRVVLGALLGYLFAWSGNLLVPIAGHFTQNFFQLLLLYLQQRGTIEFDADSTEALPWYTMLVSAVLSFGLLYWLYQRREGAVAPATTEIHTLTSKGIAVTAPAAGEAHTLSSTGVANAPGSSKSA